MIEYINKENIDDRVLKKAAFVLENGGLVAYPTDTSWGIGASVYSKKGIEILRRLKHTFQDYTLTMICSNISDISDVAELSNSNFKIIKKYSPGPFVFILPAKDKIERKINVKRLEIGVRIPSNPVSVKIVETLNAPIFSITASKKMSSQGWWDNEYAEDNLFEYGWELEDINEIDLILDTGEKLTKILSTVVNLVDNKVEIIRQGIGKFV